MSKKSLINKKALRYIIANSNLCKHAIRELELAGYSKEEDGSIHDVDAFSKVPVKKFLFATRTWTENIHKIGWIGGLFETDENGILTGRYFGRCNVRDYQNGYMPKGKKEIPCREIEISPDNWIMTVESNNEALIELSKIYDIVWRQCPCLKGIMNTNVTPELERLACEQMKG